MTRSKRAISILRLYGILILSLTSAGQADVMTLRSFTISGNVGLPGVRLEGLPKSVVSDENGHYMAYVTAVWWGTVTPVKEGYVFDPPQRTYTSVNADLIDQDYVPTVVTYTISGNVGLPGVSLQGLPGNPQSDVDGNYAADVETTWSGTAIPYKPGFTFSPTSRIYDAVTGNVTNQDYTGTVRIVTISGRVGMPGVTLLGLPGNPRSDENGVFSVEVPYAWSGVVEAEKAGYVFEPKSRSYQSVRRDLGSQDYVPRPQMLTISDVVSLGGQPIPNVSVTTEPEVAQDLTDMTGRYAIRVPWGWSGRLILSKPGYVFNPSSIPYNNVTTHVIDGKEIPASETPSISRATPPIVRPQVSLAGDTSAVVVIPTSEVDPTMLTQVKEDMGIMLQILREKLSEPRTILGTLYDFGDFFDSGGGTEALYLEGYGAVFVMKVSFPLMSATSPSGSEPEPAGDPVWQRARQRLYTPGGISGRSGTTPIPTDPESFEQFKDDMTGMLKHAANIRHLPADESVVLTIVSQVSQSPGRFGQAARSSYGSGGSYGGGFVAGGTFSSSSSFSSSGQVTTYGRTGGYGGGAYGATGGQNGYGGASAPGTVLTLRAAKADIDAFAQGDITFEQFCTKVKTISY